MISLMSEVIPAVLAIWRLVSPISRMYLSTKKGSFWMFLRFSFRPNKAPNLL